MAMSISPDLYASSPPSSLPPELLREMLRYMLLARMLDERMWLLNRAGKAPFVVSCQGHEAAQIGAAFALDQSKDFTLPYYRGLGTVLVMGMTPAEIMLSVFARAADPSSGGRQMPSHFSSRERRIVSQSSVVATQVVHAAGVGLAEKLRGGDAIAWTSFGDGSTSQGDFHEGLNLAAVHKLPVIFQCENNGYAISVPQHKQMAITQVSERGPAYGMPGVSVDGTDVLAVYEQTLQAVTRARIGEGPTLIEARVVRLTPHSSDGVVRLTPHSSDDNDRTYRPAEELKNLPQRDPLPRFLTYLYEHDLLSDAEERDLRQMISAEIDAATEAAEQAAPPEPATLLDHLYMEQEP